MLTPYAFCMRCRGGLLQTLQLLDEEEDINKVLSFFSYEHFYVVYCKVAVPPKDAAVAGLQCCGLLLRTGTVAH